MRLSQKLTTLCLGLDLNSFWYFYVSMRWGWANELLYEEKYVAIEFL